MYNCEYCNRVLKSKSGYTSHIKVCGSKVVEVVNPLLKAIREFEKAKARSK